MKVIIDGVVYVPEHISVAGKKIELEDHNFRVNSDGWNKITVDGNEYLESPNKDMWEILGDECRGEQLFTWKAAMRETKKAGKRLPTDEELSEILKTTEDLENITFPGYRNTAGSFYARGSYTYLWSSSARDMLAWRRSLYSSTSPVSRSTNSQSYGFSVRCIKAEKVDAGGS